MEMIDGTRPTRVAQFESGLDSCVDISTSGDNGGSHFEALSEIACQSGSERTARSMRMFCFLVGEFDDVHDFIGSATEDVADELLVEFGVCSLVGICEREVTTFKEDIFGTESVDFCGEAFETFEVVDGEGLFAGFAENEGCFGNVGCENCG